MSQTPSTDWRVNLRITHPQIQEPQVMREARVLRRLREYLAANAEDVRDNERSKIEKVINTRLLNILDEARDAAP